MSLLDREYFEELARYAHAQLAPREFLFISLEAEQSYFLRINRSKIRQQGSVQDANLSLTMVCESSDGLRSGSRSFSVCGNEDVDRRRLRSSIDSLKTDVPQLPVDPFAEKPRLLPSSAMETAGSLADPVSTFEDILSPLEGVDFVGFYAGGPIVRALANSEGLTHWFKTETFVLDYSVYAPNQKAVKGLMGGRKWDLSLYRAQIEEDIERLAHLNVEPKKVTPADYRVYLAPHSVADLLGMFSWGCVGEGSIQRGDSPLRHLRSGEKSFSELLSIAEDFTSGEMPRWNEEGELAPENLTIFKKGQLKNTLISTRTAREYGCASNFASSGEGLRSAVVQAGDLAENEILKKLDTGLYLSNLHYLNWSDQTQSRITGMTRYACFWVEGGKIIAPIENLRFDDTLFRILGENLEALTQRAHIFPETSTYGMRNLGSSRAPGALVSKMKFTL